MPDFSYTPELLSQLQAQLRGAAATGLPWMIEGAQRAYDYAVANGANLPFDARGNDLPGAPPLPALPPQVADANAQTGTAIATADPAVFAPPPPAPDSLGTGSVTTPPATAPPAADTTPPPTLEEDPAYQAFVRALGAERSTAENNTNTSVDAANRAAALRLPQIADAGALSRDKISGGFETRGLLRSGQHEQALAQQRQGEAAQSSAVTDSAAQQVANLRAGLAGQETGFDSRLAEQNLAASGRLQASQDAQRLASTEQQGIAGLTASNTAALASIAARQDAALGITRPPGAPPPATPQSTVVQNATAANPVGITQTPAPDPTDPDYLQKLIASMSGR